MPDQYTVPQFIDAEDKILGPMTVRQFIIVLVTFLIDGVLFKLIPNLIGWLFAAVVVLVAGGALAFVRINGMPFHFFLLNLVQTLKKPKLRVWDKTLPDAEVKTYMKTAEAPPPPPPPRKTMVSTSRLQELALVVNTGGVYRPED